jgi:hypothetical protein
MADWPALEELTRNSSKRGGQNVGQGAKKARVQITLRTQLYCGSKVEVTDRVHPNEIDSTRTKLTKNINNQAAHHILRCAKCKPHYQK